MARASDADTFANRLLAWFDKHGRHNLPWQYPRTPYRVWVAEIMLQQTQVATVIPYYDRFIERFSDLPTLARAHADEVMALWAGLGYYSRARNLQKAAQVCLHNYAGKLPTDFAQLLELPGIGRSTAAAILAQAHGQRHPILDGNVKRVLARHEGISGWPGKSSVASKLWSASDKYTPNERLADYTQGIMDLGATVCKRSQPACDDCPLNKSCYAAKHGKQAMFPGKRAKKALPHRETWVVLQQDQQGRLLLERRPPSGIWGGLWCLPMREDLTPENGIATSAPVLHTFSHFRLSIRPVMIREATIADHEQRWCSADDVVTLGLPRPIARIIEQFFEDEITWHELSVA